MLALLTISTSHRGGVLSFVRYLRRDRIITEDRSFMGINIRHIRYIHNRGRINWRRIHRKAETTELLCGEDVYIPSDSGMKKFEPWEFRSRLCANAGLEILRQMRCVPPSLRIGLYDPKGEVQDMPRHILRLTNNLVVVTDNRNLYMEQAGILMEEMGAVLRVSCGVSELFDCGLVIAPGGIDRRLSLRSDSVVLCPQLPMVSLRGQVYFRYEVELSEGLSEFCPGEIGSDVLAGGLYSLCGVYELGALSPANLSCGREGVTPSVISNYLEECFGT
ncbi:MAG: hypothetical protein IJV88_01230 [Ruminococcus sp.]|nr:hypothetical protein [Ruminococcus sp.]